MTGGGDPDYGLYFIQGVINLEPIPHNLPNGQRPLSTPSKPIPCFLGAPKELFDECQYVNFSDVLSNSYTAIRHDSEGRQLACLKVI